MTTLMTPGPTEVPPDVREAMSRQIQNPDVDPEFNVLYRELTDELARVYDTDDEIVVLGGEGMLGLEASVASLVGPGDEVLCLANGPFGEGFADFVELYGGEPIVYEASWRAGFDVDRVTDYLEANDVAVATMVHCETPTGLLNDLDEILDVLSDAGVITVVDAVSSLGGTPVPTNADVVIGASQKCFSAPPGLTTLSISDEAWATVEATETRSFYADLERWHDPDLDEPYAFPYTHLVSNCYGLEVAIERLLEEGLASVYRRHETVAEECREMGQEIGLDPYPAEESLYSPTVTAFEIESNASQVVEEVLAEHDVRLATGLGEIADDVIRVGHMGYAADGERVAETMEALADVLGD
ncbi:MAG: pyridoxal-phosphate-dependent aminotransferase family protein [Halanaeroarchaeum sp.]